MTKVRKGDSNAWNSAVSQAKDVIQKGINTAWQNSAAGKDSAARKQAKQEDDAVAHRESVDNYRQNDRSKDAAYQAKKQDEAENFSKEVQSLRQSKPDQHQGSRKGEVSNIKDHKLCHRPDNIPEVASKVVSGMKRTISVRGEYEDGLPNADTMLGSRKGSRKGANNLFEMLSADQVSRIHALEPELSIDELQDFINEGGMDEEVKRIAPSEFNEAISKWG